MTVPAGERLTLRYRTYVHDGIPDTDTLQAAYQQYLAAATVNEE